MYPKSNPRRAGADAAATGSRARARTVELRGRCLGSDLLRYVAEVGPHDVPHLPSTDLSVIEEGDGQKHRGRGRLLLLGIAVLAVLALCLGSHCLSAQSGDVLLTSLSVFEFVVWDGVVYE